MAKVNTGKARKLAGVRVDLPDTPSTVEDSISTGYGERLRYVLRSDGTVLRSYQTASYYPNQAPYWGSQNYKVIGTVKDLGSFDLVRFVTRKHPNATQIVSD